jgi:methionyl-tRNA formyltransferase
MEKHELRIVFMGTPDFAVASLSALVENGYPVVAVITAPDKEAGRGKQIRFSAVKEFALEHKLPVLQPEKLKNEHFLQQLKDLKANLQVVVAFRMLPEVVWDMPELGTFNLHASQLPQYRGAAPINHAIIRGERVTGLTTFFLDKEIDTGRIIDQVEIDIHEEDNFETLHDRMMEAGAMLVVETIEKIRKGKVEAVDQSKLIQPREVLHTAPKIFKEFCHINWAMSSKEIYDFIRGLSPHPVAYSFMETSGEKKLLTKIYNADFEETTHHLKPGKILSDQKTYIKVATKDGYIQILELQIPGKKRLSTDAFLRGFQENLVLFS